MRRYGIIEIVSFLLEIKRGFKVKEPLYAFIKETV